MNFQKTVDRDRLSKEIRESVITISLDHIISSGTSCDVFFKAPLPTNDEAILNVIINKHIATPLPLAEYQNVAIVNSKKTSRGILEVAVGESEGSSATIVSHNWCDKTSWASGSIEVVTQVLTLVSVNSYKYQTKTHWIDLEHGKLYDEEAIMAKAPINKYRPKIYIDGVLKVENFKNLMGEVQVRDYSINYAAGVVNFTNVTSGVVTASFYYADKSYFIVKPTTGNILTIKTAEIQFAKNIVIDSPFVFEVWVFHTGLQQMVPYPNSAIVYKNVSDFMSASNEGSVIPAWGGMANDLIVLPFKYVRPKPVIYSSTAEIRVYVRNHQQVVGEMATATFYVVIDPEIMK